jgi:gliding motility-associated-like protein
MLVLNGANIINACCYNLYICVFIVIQIIFGLMLTRLTLKTIQLVLPFLFFWPIWLHAQLCTGSLGEAVVNIDFGAGANPGPSLTNTTYLYNAGTCPNDGQYGIRSSLTSCFDATWQDVVEDHTPGDINGYCMVINASYTPGDFYVATVNNLCSNTTYEFAAWIMNVLKPTSCNNNSIQPIVNFNIETIAGTVLGSYSTGQIPSTSSVTWKQYGLFFTTPAGVNDVVIRMTNNAPGGCGNDLVLDDITFKPCGPTVLASIINSNTNNLDVCEGALKNVPLAATISGGYNNPVYQWQQRVNNIWQNITGATLNNYNAVTTTVVGTYEYRFLVAEQGNIYNTSCRIASNIVTINITASPPLTINSNSPVCINKNIMLTAIGGTSYVWKGPDNFTSQQAQPLVIASAASAGKYYVTATSAKGCTKTDSLIVAIANNPIANAGDDVNLCEGQSVQLNATGGNSYLWNNANSLSSALIANPVANPVDTTLFAVTVTSNITGCSDNDTVAIFVNKKPVANAGPDKKISEGQSIKLEGVAKGSNISYNWLPNLNINNNNLLQPLVSPVTDQYYTLTVTSNAGCGIATDEVFVRVFKKVLVPNVFSPNGDGINDVWKIEALQTYPECSLQVFNRYGQIVFNSKGYNTYWNGTYNNKPLPFGTYYYIIDLKNNMPVLKGSVTIIR